MSSRILLNNIYFYSLTMVIKIRLLINEIACDEAKIDSLTILGQIFPYIIEKNSLKVNAK